MQAIRFTLLLAITSFSCGVVAQDSIGDSAEVFPINDEQVRQLCPGDSELVTARACLQVNGNIETQIVDHTSAVTGYRTTDGNRK